MKLFIFNKIHLWLFSLLKLVIGFWSLAFLLFSARSQQVDWSCSFDSSFCNGILRFDRDNDESKFESGLKKTINSTNVTDVTSISKIFYVYIWLLYLKFKTFLVLMSIKYVFSASPTSDLAIGPYNQTVCRIPWQLSSTEYYFCSDDFKCQTIDDKINFCQKGWLNKLTL